MWLTKITELPISIKMKFETPVHLSALTVWNYNASPDASYCGVCLKFIDNRYIAPKFKGSKNNGNFRLQETHYLGVSKLIRCGQVSFLKQLPPFSDTLLLFKLVLPLFTLFRKWYLLFRLDYRNCLQSILQVCFEANCILKPSCTRPRASQFSNSQYRLMISSDGQERMRNIRKRNFNSTCTLVRSFQTRNGPLI